jgi:hypothetical protein
MLATLPIVVAIQAFAFFGSAYEPTSVIVILARRARIAVTRHLSGQNRAWERRAVGQPVRKKVLHCSHSAKRAPLATTIAVSIRG